MRGQGTTTISAYKLDRCTREWQIVSATSTVNLEWGLGIMDERTGIIYNNEMDDFSIPKAENYFQLPPSEANFIEPNKRPLSSSCPLILLRHGKPFMALGGAGGSRIISAVLQVCMLLEARVVVTFYACT